mgnify:CR=1 FL=1
MALTNLVGTITSSFGLTLDKTNTALSNSKLSLDKDYSIAYTYGSADNKASMCYSKKHTIAASATLTLDLDGSSMEDPYGDTLDFNEIKAFRIYLVSENNGASDVSVAGDWVTTIFGASTSYPLVAGSIWQHIDSQGLTVTATTGDVIAITNNDATNAASVVVDIIGN